MDRRLLAIAVSALAACADDPPAPPVAAPALELPGLIALPYVEAGAGPVSTDVVVRNPGTAELAGLTWSLGGDPTLTVVAAPGALAAGAEAAVTIRWDGAAAPRITGGTLTVASAIGPRTAEVWAVAGDPGLAPATFEDLVSPGGLRLGASAVVAMPTAPFPAPGRPWTDARVHLFVPDGYRQRDAHDLVLHFHGHNTTIDATVASHRYREHVHASGADVILVVPQGPVEAASGDFGKLADPAGTEAFLAEVLTVLYRAGVVTRPVLGDVILTSHSGGYQAVARNLGPEAGFVVPQVDLFDSLYGYASTYRDFALGGGRLRSDYTATGGTADSNVALRDTLVTAGLAVATTPTAEALRDAPAVIFPTAASHEGSTRDDGAYGEQLRWGRTASRRGPRAELRTVTATGGVATVTWLAPRDPELTGWRVETARAGGPWTLAAETGPDATRASVPLDGGAHVRLVPVVPGVADPQPSDAYRVDPDAEVLVVDGFDRVVDGSWRGLAHDFAARIGDDVGAVHTASNEAVMAGLDLTQYRAVIWLVGDESLGDHSLTAAEQGALDAFVAGGGRLIVSGSELGYELGASPGGRAWLARIAGASYAADDAGATRAAGAGALAGLPGFDFGGARAPYTEEFPDAYAATTGGAIVLAYPGGAGAAVGIAGRAVVVGFPLEVVEDPAARAALVRALLGFVRP